MLDPKSIQWPSPWQAIADERASLEFGMKWNNEVRPSIINELHREICSSHPLFGVQCRPIAFDAKVKKEFLFETDIVDMPLVLVHFTWMIEKDPRWPIIIPFQSINEFITWAQNS